MAAAWSFFAVKNGRILAVNYAKVVAWDANGAWGLRRWDENRDKQVVYFQTG
jgi:hypothetical protein